MTDYSMQADGSVAVKAETSPKPFKIGDILILKSGGPAMTLTEIENILATCEWFDGDQKHFSSVFPIACLMIECSGPDRIEATRERKFSPSTAPIAAFANAKAQQLSSDAGE